MKKSRNRFILQDSHCQRETITGHLNQVLELLQRKKISKPYDSIAHTQSHRWYRFSFNWISNLKMHSSHSDSRNLIPFIYVSSIDLSKVSFALSLSFFLSSKLYCDDARFSPCVCTELSMYTIQDTEKKFLTLKTVPKCDEFAS